LSSPKLEVLTSFPAGAPVVSDYLEGAPGAVAFYGAHFRDLADYRRKAEEVDGRFDRAAREGAASAVIVPRGGNDERLRRFVSEGGYMVTTGQQPGLFGGPLYNLYKGLTVIRLAESLERALGKPVLPLFWMGSEDHDWDEANHTSLIGVDNELHSFSVAAPEPDRHPPLHRITLGEDAGDALRRFGKVLPPSEFVDRYLSLIRDASGPGATLAGGFSAILEEVLGPLGIYLTDAAHPRVKELSRPVLLRDLDENEELERVLRSTDAALETAGYARQVHLMEGGVNLFLETPSGRERLYRGDGGFTLHTSGRTVTRSEIVARFDEDPTVLTPNVFLRPVVESTVFPTLSYVGGPGEMAYFAQLRGYFEALGVMMPVIHPRHSAVIVETKIRKVLDKFGASMDFLHRPFHEVAGDLARDEVPEGVAKALGGLKGALARGVAELQKETATLDPTLKGPVQHLRSQAFAALEDVEKKILHAVKRENETALAQLEKAQLHLFPGGKPQERVLNPFYYLARYGEAFMVTLRDAFTVDLS